MAGCVAARHSCMEWNVALVLPFTPWQKKNCANQYVLAVQSHGTLSCGHSSPVQGSKQQRSFIGFLLLRHWVVRVQWTCMTEGKRGLMGLCSSVGWYIVNRFAAEIFRDLHDELMAIGGRGHDLMVRLQQLEAELPVVEKALLSEPNQLRFAYSPGNLLRF